jgi:hypothetical protein
VHDLAQSLIVEAGVGQSRNAEVRLMQCVPPSPDPVFSSIACSGFGLLSEAGQRERAGCEQRNGEPSKHRPH